MTTRRRGLTRRAALAGLAGIGELAAAGWSPAQDPAQPVPGFEKVPVKGKAGPGLEPFDAAMLEIMDRHGIPGGAFALARGGANCSSPRATAGPTWPPARPPTRTPCSGWRACPSRSPPSPP